MRNDSGSVFIESMVAAAIVALALGAMYRVIEDGAMRNRMVNEKQTALLIAQSELAAVGSAIPLAQGMTGGTEGPYAWRIDIAPSGLAGAASSSGELWQVTVSVRSLDSDNAIVTLDSLAVGPGA
jgi:general secretion pathway protein I